MTGIPLLVVLLLVCAAAAYLVLPARQARDVALPPRDATPREVVTAFLEAMDAHDCDTAEDLVLEARMSWCDDIESLSRIEVRHRHTGDPDTPRHPSADHHAYVPVAFDLDWRRFRSDGSLDEGMMVWGYGLVRASTDEPWRISSQGVG